MDNSPMSGAIKINGRRKGDNLERAVVLDQERIGRIAFRVRQGGGECVDVIALWGWPAHHERSSVYMIQCKATNPYLPPAEKEALMMKAKAAGAIPMVAWRDGRTIQYKVIG